MNDSKDLVKQIQEDDKKPPASAEKPLKIEAKDFDEALDKILPPKPEKPKDD